MPDTQTALALAPPADATERDLSCDMDRGCAENVAYIDDKGWIYCQPHGLDRQASRRCRKLRPHELRRLRRGQTITGY